jgi:hypothetical protein
MVEVNRTGVGSEQLKSFTCSLAQALPKKLRSQWYSW